MKGSNARPIERDEKVSRVHAALYLGARLRRRSMNGKRMPTTPTPDAASARPMEHPQPEVVPVGVDVPPSPPPASKPIIVVPASMVVVLGAPASTTIGTHASCRRWI